MTNKMKIWSLVAIGLAITIFWAMLSMIFKSVVFQNKSGWEFLQWWFCDAVATLGGISTFVFVYIRVMKK
jgi:hypothetical protein